MSWSLQIYRSDLQLFSSISVEIDTTNHTETVDIVPKLEMRLDDSPIFDSQAPGEGDEYRVFLNSRHYATGMLTDVGSDEEGDRNLLGVDWTHFILGPKVTRRFVINRDIGEAVRDTLQRFAPKVGTKYVFDLGKTFEHDVEVTRRDLLDTIINLAEVGDQEWIIDQNKEFLLFREDLFPILHDGFTTSTPSNQINWSAISGSWVYTGTTIQQKSNTANTFFQNDPSGVWKGARYADGKVQIDKSTAQAAFVLFRQPTVPVWEVYAGVQNQNLLLTVIASGVTSTVSVATSVFTNSFHRLAVIATESDYRVTYDGSLLITEIGLLHPPIGHSGWLGLRGLGGNQEYDDMRYGEGRIIDLLDSNTLEAQFPPQQIEKIAKVTVLGGKERLKDTFDQDLSRWNFTPGFERVGEEVRWSKASKGLITSKIDSWEDFDYSLNAIVNSGNDLSLVWRFANSDNYYLYTATTFTDSAEDYIVENQWKVAKVVTGSEIPIARGTFDGININAEQEYLVQAHGTTHTVGVKEGLLYQFADTDIARGAVGVRVGSGSYTLTEIFLEADRRVIGNKTDDALQRKWGNKVKQIPLPDIHTVSEANKRAEVELALATSPPLRGTVLMDGSYGARPPSTVWAGFPQFNVSSLFKIITTEQIIGEDDWQTRYQLVEITPYIEEFLSKLKGEFIATEAQVEQEELFLSTLGTQDSFMTGTFASSKRTTSWRDIGERFKARALGFRHVGSRYRIGANSSWKDLTERVKISKLNAKVGSFNTGTVTGNLSITVGFKPKVVLFWGTKATGTADASGAGASLSFGAAESSTKRWAMWGEDLDAVAGGTSDSKTDLTKCYIIYTAGTPTIDGLMDLVSMDSVGFTVNRVDAFAADYRVNYLALGGDILVDVNSFQNTSTGTQDVTTPGFQPNLVLFGSIAAPDDTSITDLQMSLGWTIGSATNQNFTATGITEDANGAAVATRRYAFQGECCSVATTSAADEVTRRGILSTFLSNGFRMNWLETPGVNTRILYVALSVPSVATGVYGTFTSAPNDIDLLTSFRPKVIISLMHGKVLDAQDTGATGMELMFGVSTGLRDEKCVHIGSLDAGANSDSGFADKIEKHYLNYTQGGTPTIEGEADVTNIKDNEFIITQTDGDPSSNEVGWLAIGE